MHILDCTYHAFQHPLFIIYRDDQNRQKISTSIIIDLGEVRFINYIEMLLMDEDSRSYSYNIDVSLDGKEYKRLLSNKYCRSWQYLLFHSRLVRFIKLVGTAVSGSTHKRPGYLNGRLVNLDSLEIITLRALSATNANLELFDGVIKPLKNVATVELGAIVEKGIGGNNMLNKNFNDFTCHEIGSYILLRFNQPYYIASIRMLLGNNENFGNKHSVCIETSMDNANWTMAVDKRNLSGWQEFDFPGRSAIFIRIKGTQTDAVSLYSYRFLCHLYIRIDCFKLK